MKASVAWLNALLPNESVRLTPSEISSRLTGAGLEVEGMEAYGAASPSVFVAEVAATEPHPSRPKLSLVTVKTAGRGGADTHKIVCGAPNVPAPGGRVAFAPVGAHLPAVGMTLSPKDIGGIASAGMLCSERELGLLSPAAAGGTDPGILILDSTRGQVGDPLSLALPESCDTILEIGLTPNRPDGLGHIGLARELAALTGGSFQPPTTTIIAGSNSPTAIRDVISIDIQDLERCPHYGAALLTDISIAPSPSWLKYRLESLGLRSISNVVDITNWVMLEFGHPIHAFDLAHVRGAKIIIRRAADGEVLKTLDDVERKLANDELVIADGEGALALAGVMGGAGSEIRSDTKQVLIECAYFAPRGVRRAARRHGLHTESSHRFERGVDPGDIDAVLRRTQSLLVEIAGAKAAPETIMAGTPQQARTAIPLRAARMKALLGLAIPLEEAKETLTRLGASIVSGDADSINVVPPTHRPDVTMEADLIEEVMRVHGVDNIPTVLPAIRPQPPRSDASATAADTERAVRKAAIELGLFEAITYSFVSERDLTAIHAPAPVVKLKNPLSEERTVMRTSLLPGLFEALRRARRHGVTDVRLFTTGSRFLTPTTGHPALGKGLPREARSFAAVLAGHRRVRLEKPIEVDVYDIVGIARELCQRCLGRAVQIAPQPPDSRAHHLHPRGAGNILIENQVVGTLGPVHPEVVEAMDLGGACFTLEVDVDALAALGRAAQQFKPIPTLPASTRDIALVVSDDVPAGDVQQAITVAASDLIESVELFDLFRGGSIPDGHRSLAFHVVYRDPLAATAPDKARTLTDKEVDKRHDGVVKSMRDRFGATLRG